MHAVDPTRDAGADRSSSDLQRAVPVDQGDGSDLDARDVGDRVERSWLAGQEDLESPGPWSSVMGMRLG
jgi:hypothetical protein